MRLEVIPIALPFREPYVTASGRLEGRSMAVVRLWGENGGPGIGEAVPLSLRGGQSLEAVAEDLESRCAPILAASAPTPTGSITEAAAWIAALVARCQSERVGAPALAAVDTALHDLAGKSLGLQMWRLLGVEEPRELEINASIDARSPQRAAALAAEQAACGFQTFKVKVGADATEDAERVRAVREVVGESARVRVDANGAWSIDEALSRLEELEPATLELVEQPCAALADLAALRTHTPVPVVADESVSTAAEADAAQKAGACDAATLKLSKVGGSLEVMRIARALPCYLSSALDGPIGIAAALHTAQALPHTGAAAEYAHGLGTLSMFGATYASNDGLNGPRLRPPDAPGIGITVGEDALDNFRIR